MMSGELFILTLAIFFATLFVWAFRTLPQERWQIIAAMPGEKTGSGQWQGLNFTYYGLFYSAGNAFAAAMSFLLLGAIGLSRPQIFVLLTIVFAICVPASRIIARKIEKKEYTFTVGGGLFAGVIVTPWLIFLQGRATDSSFLNSPLSNNPFGAASAGKLAFDVVFLFIIFLSNWRPSF